MGDSQEDLKSLDLFKLSQEDREFLHDIANPLSIAGGLIEAFREDTVRSNLTLTESQDRKLKKIANALDRVERSINERRARLIALQNTISSKP